MLANPVATLTKCQREKATTIHECPNTLTLGRSPFSLGNDYPAKHIGSILKDLAGHGSRFSNGRRTDGCAFDEPNAVNMKDWTMKTKTLSPELLRQMDSYWRAANYLSVGQIYLYDNPLLKRPLTLADVKHMLLGQRGHDSRAELHLRALESGDQEIRPRHDLRFGPRARRTGCGRQHLP
jgi:hypothetical protein